MNIVLVECKKHCFRLQKHQGRVFSGKKAPGRAAPHRRPSWGCTKTNPEWECSNLFQIYFKLTLDLHGSIFRKSSENLDDMGLGCGRVPKIIPMQVQGGLRGPLIFTGAFDSGPRPPTLIPQNTFSPCWTCFNQCLSSYDLQTSRPFSAYLPASRPVRAMVKGLTFRGLS